MKIFSELSLCLGLILAIAPWIHAQDIPWDDVGKTGSDLADLATRDASDLTNTPAGNIAATDAQAAINELDTEKATTAQGGLADSATQPGDNVSTLTNDSGYLTTALANPQFAAKAPRRGIVSTGASALARLPAVASFDFGTADGSPGGYYKLPDWTPATSVTIWTKRSDSSAGYALSVNSSGILALSMYDGSGTTSFSSTVAHGIADGNWALVQLAIDRSANLIFYVNGVALGSPVDISAQSAVSQTSTHGWVWLENNAASVRFPGSVGESWWASGVVTLAQIAAIHANGTARGSGLTMLAHWEPSLSQDVLFEDISGNNNHAILGTTGISLNYELVESSAPASQALVSDGSNGTKLYATLNGQGPTTNDFAVFYSGLYTQEIVESAVHSLLSLTDDATDVIQEGGILMGHLGGDFGYAIYIFGATGSDYLRYTSAPLHAQMLSLTARGIPVMLGIIRESGVPRFTLGFSGKTYDITSLFELTEGGEIPDWTDTLSVDYLVGLYRDSTRSSDAGVSGYDLLNFAPTFEEIDYRIRNGGWEPKYASGESALYTTDFSTSTGWVMSNGTVAIASGVASYDGSADVTMYRNFPDGVRVGMPVRLTFTSSATGKLYFQGNQTTQWLKEFSVVYDVNVAVGVNVFEGTLSSVASQRFGIRFRSAGGAWDMDDLTLDILGVTSSLDLSDGGGYQPKNPRAANGSSQWSMSTSGVTWTKPTTYGKTLSVTGSLTWAGTHEAKSLLGQKALPSNAIIDAITFVATAGSTGDGITIGTTTDPDQFVTVNTYTTTAENFAGSQLTSPFPGGTATNDLTIVVDPDTANYTGSITTTVTYHLANY